VLEVEDSPQRCVNAAHLFKAEISDALTESTRVDCGGLFSQHPCDVCHRFRPRAESLRPVLTWTSVLPATSTAVADRIGPRRRIAPRIVCGRSSPVERATDRPHHARSVSMSRSTCIASALSASARHPPGNARSPTPLPGECGGIEHSGLPNETYPSSLSSDESRHFEYTGVTDYPPGTGRADDALAGAFHEEEVSFRWMSSRRTTRSSISAM
jgi:hypothetical protein